MVTTIGIEAQKYMLVFFRVMAVLWLLPIFSSRSVAFPFKAALALAISFIFYDLVDIRAVGSDPYYIALILVKEIFIGLTISFFVRLLFGIIYAAGEVAGLQTGFSFARSMDPTTMSQVSVLEQFMNLITIMVFFAIDAHHIIIKGMFQSFREIPVGGAAINTSLLQYMISISSRIFSVGLKIAAPLVVTLFIVELAFGLLSRMIPQVNIFIEGMPIKIIITMLVLSLSLGIIVPAIVDIFRNMDMEISRILRLMV